MKVGYVRVATTAEQSLFEQKEALLAAGCDKIFIDIASGKKSHRSEFEKAVDFLSTGDLLVVYKVDRLGSSVQELVQIMLLLNARNIHFISIQDGLDSRLDQNIFKLFITLSEYQRNLVLERTEKGLTAAKARGRLGGRPFRLNLSQITHMMELYDQGLHSVVEICKKFNISRPSFYNYLRTYNFKTQSLKSV